ncbi:MAG TPA: beta-propeller fold lactonase family protein, partial [Kofleriaceae bacterium]
EVASFKIDKATGTLGTPTSMAPVGTGASSVVVHPSRRFAYVINGNNGVPGGASNVVPNSISVYALDPVTGAISGPIDTQPANANPITAVVHPSGKFIYVVNEQRFGTTTGNISVYSIDPTTGHLTPQGTSADLLGPPATAIAFTPSGRFAFVTYIPAPTGSTTFFNTVNAFSVDPSTGVLSGPVSNALTGDNPWAVAVTHDGKSAYVASLGVQGSVNDLTRYSIDPPSGRLTRRDSLYLGGEPAALAVDPEDRFLYAARQQVDNNQNLFVFAIDSASGALTPTSNTLTSNGSGPIAVVADPQAAFVYATGNGAIVPYVLDAAGGTLVPQSATGPIGGGGGGGVGDPFSFAASGTSPVWVNGCTFLGDDVFVTGTCPLPSGIGTIIGGGSGTSAETDMALSQSATHQLDVSTGTWGGVITSSPAGIAYNSDGDPQAFVSASFATGSTVSLCATPPASATQVYDFKWTGSGGCSGTATCTTVRMTADEGCHLELTARPPGT